MKYTFAIGDIHGCLSKLETILNAIEAYSDGGTVVFLGDYVDRGPDSYGVIKRIMAGPPSDAWKWIALKGNHEDMMTSCIRGEAPFWWWLENGGMETLSSFPGNTVPVDVIEWADNLALFHADERRIFVHAAVDETIPLDDQSEGVLLWKRYPKNYSGEYWGKHLCHGHTPDTEFHPITIGNRTNIDSGAVFGGKLTCAVFRNVVGGGPIDFLQSYAREDDE